jgi:hypothetical protein
VSGRDPDGKWKIEDEDRQQQAGEGGQQLSTAIEYARRGFRVFPCGENKAPIGSLVRHGNKNATTDHDIIARWWRARPDALIGTPTGRAAGFVVLDIDRKNGVDGVATLRVMDVELPMTPTVLTRSRGAHVYFEPPEGRLIRNSAGLIGPGLDWRGEGGHVILPSPGSGYSWVEGTEGLPLADVPAQLMPPESEEVAIGPARYCEELSVDGERMLFEAVERILSAPAGEQETTLTWEARLVGRMAASGTVPAKLALEYLLLEIAGGSDEPVPLRSYNPKWPWRKAELARKITGAFRRGLALPFPDYDAMEREMTRLQMEGWVDD